MKLHRLGTTAAVAMTATLALAACGGDPVLTTPSSAGEPGTPSDQATASGEALSGSLSASGASSQESAMTAWIAGYQGVQPGVTVNYEAIGSGAGRDNLLSGASAYIGSDAFLDEEERAAVIEVCGPGGALHFPVYISPIAIPYNLPGVDALNLAPDVLAGIFNGQITSWNDPAISADNAGVELPDTEITVVHRSDESGTTENVMEYLTAAAPDAWPHEPSDAWPVEGQEAAAQTTGVIEVVGSTEGTIGYADASAVGTLSTASIGVGEDFVAYSPEAAAAVVDASSPADTGTEGDLALELARDTTASGAYPIVLVSYHIVCTSYDDPATAALVKDFLTYVSSPEGQSAAADAAGSAPISDDLRSQITSSIALIQAG